MILNPKCDTRDEIYTRIWDYKRNINHGKIVVLIKLFKIVPLQYQKEFETIEGLLTMVG